MNKILNVIKKQGESMNVIIFEKSFIQYNYNREFYKYIFYCKDISRETILNQNHTTYFKNLSSNNNNIKYVEAFSSSVGTNNVWYLDMKDKKNLGYLNKSKTHINNNNNSSSI